MTVPFGFATRVVLVGLKVPFDRLRPYDSILVLVRMSGRFDNEVVWGALKCFGSYAWTWGTVMDGAVQGNAFPESIFRFRSPSKQPYRSMAIQPSAHPSYSILFLVITRVLFRCRVFTP